MSLSLIMRKPAYCICENKDADQLCGNRTTDQRLCFRYTIVQFLYYLNLKFQALVIFCGCTAQFVSDWSETPKTGYISHDEAHIMTFRDTFQYCKLTFFRCYLFLGFCVHKFVCGNLFLLIAKQCTVFLFDNFVAI